MILSRCYYKISNFLHSASVEIKFVEANLMPPMLTKSYYGKRKETPKMRKKDTQKCSFFAYDFSDKKGHIFCEQTKCVCENVCFMIPTKY